MSVLLRAKVLAGVLFIAFVGFAGCASHAENSRPQNTNVKHPAKPTKAAKPASSSSQGATIPKERALQIVTNGGKLFLGTWVTVSLRNNAWHFSASSKSAKPPVYYVVDGTSGKLVYSNLNSDAKQVPAKFSKAKATQSYRLEKSAGKTLWVREP